MANELYPIFLKLEELQLLIVGGGKVAHEKLKFLLKSSPKVCVTILSPELSLETAALVSKFGLKVVLSNYESGYLRNKNIVIAATNDREINRRIYEDAKVEGVLVNVVDTPALCDFYLGAIVTKGDLKLAISTNGNSPILAKRLRQFFEDVLPDDSECLVNNLGELRQLIGGNLSEKIRRLNTLTQDFVHNLPESL